MERSRVNELRGTRDFIPVKLANDLDLALNIACSNFDFHHAGFHGLCFRLVFFCRRAINLVALTFIAWIYIQPATWSA